MAEILETRQGIFPDAADNNLKAAQGVVGQDYLKPSQTQEKILQTTQEAITRGAKGRGPEEIVDKALDEIGKSTETFTGLKEAAKSLTDSFVDAAKSIGDSALKFISGTPTGASLKQPITKTVGGR